MSETSVRPSYLIAQAVMPSRPMIKPLPLPLAKPLDRSIELNGRDIEFPQLPLSAAERVRKLAIANGVPLVKGATFSSEGSFVYQRINGRNFSVIGFSESERSNLSFQSVNDYFQKKLGLQNIAKLELISGFTANDLAQWRNAHYQLAAQKGTRSSNTQTLQNTIQRLSNKFEAAMCRAKNKLLNTPQTTPSKAVFDGEPIDHEKYRKMVNTSNELRRLRAEKISKQDCVTFTTVRIDKTAYDQKSKYVVTTTTTAALENVQAGSGLISPLAKVVLNQELAIKNSSVGTIRKSAVGQRFDTGFPDNPAIAVNIVKIPNDGKPFDIQVSTAKNYCVHDLGNRKQEARTVRINPADVNEQLPMTKNGASGAIGIKRF